MKSTSSKIIFTLLCAFVCSTAWCLSVTRGPYLQMQTETSMNVVWLTDTECIGDVEWGSTSSYGNVAGPGPSATRHEISITGLEPDTLYHYRIRCNEVPKSGDLTFTTEPPKSSENIVFTVQGDSRGISSVCTEVFNAMIPHSENGFALSLGDLCGRGEDNITDWWQIQFFNPAKNFIGKICLYPCIGNHEVYDENSYPGYVYPEKYQQIWSLPTANSGTEIYYSFDKGNVHFVALDVFYSDFAVGSAQYNWLVNDLANSNKKWKVVFAHNGPYVSRSNALQGDSRIRSFLVPVFEIYGVDLYMHGHYHIYQRNFVNGITYLDQGCGGDTLGPGDSSQSFVQFCETNKFAFTRFDTEPDKIIGKTYGRDQDVPGPMVLFDTFEIVDNPIKPTPTPTPLTEEIIIDDGDPEFSLIGSWTYKSADYFTQPYNKDYYFCSSVSTPETKSAKWRPDLQVADDYSVYARFRQGTNRTTQAPYTVYYNGGSELIYVNQQQDGGSWVLLGTFPFALGTSGYVKLSP